MQLIVRSECCLTEAPPPLVKALQRELSIDNPRYEDAKRYGRWIGRQLQPRLRFYRLEQGHVYFPRGFANEAVRLSRQITGESPVVVDQRRLLPPLLLPFSGTLRDYQERAVDAVAAHSFGVLEAGTGSGKTVMALALIARRAQPALVLVHTRELLYQWLERIHQFLGVEAGQVGDGRRDIRPITVAIVNTARRHLNELVPACGHLLVDECHRVPATLFTETVSAFDSHYMLGLSATAFRRDDSMTRLIYMYMGERVHRVDSNTLAASGAVLQPELIQKKTTFNYRFQGDYAKLLKALTEDRGRNALILADTLKLARQSDRGTVLLVSDRRAHCEFFAEGLAAEGVAVALLTGQTGKDEREQIVVDVQAGRLQVLVATVQLIGEGFDCPGLSTLVLATPIKFEGRLLQVAGRIVRPAAGKKAVIVDYVDTAVPLLRRSAAARRVVFAGW
jgi:superfamily II DNA or RNA helicase